MRSVEQSTLIVSVPCVGTLECLPRPINLYIYIESTNRIYHIDYPHHNSVVTGTVCSEEPNENYNSYCL